MMEAPAPSSRRVITLPYMQIRYVKCTEKITGFTVAALGLIISLWANCLLVVACIQSNAYVFQHAEMFITRNIIYTSQLTHFIIVVASTTGFVVGLKEKNPTLLLPWMGIKIVELICLFIGCIVVATDNFIGLLPVGICFLLIGGYITLNVWDTYSKMSSPPDSDPEEDLDSDVRVECLSSGLPKDPPSYDSFINQPRTHLPHN